MKFVIPSTSSSNTVEIRVDRNAIEMAVYGVEGSQEMVSCEVMLSYSYYQYPEWFRALLNRRWMIQRNNSLFKYWFGELRSTIIVQ